MQEHFIKTISENARGFTAKFSQLHKRPQRLFYRGDISLLESRPCVAVVGSRKVSTYGREVTRDLSSKLAAAGVTIVSGLAIGVDSIAHNAALEAGGRTVAVLPSALERIYPVSNTHLSDKILQNNGLLLSEYNDPLPPMKHQFIERNRLIAAVSDLVLITQAAKTSGSMHTVQFALELGKTVAAVPGNINNPSHEGANRLIKTGAEPILSYIDLLEMLDLKQPINKTVYKPKNKYEYSILSTLERGPLKTSQLLRQVQMNTEIFNSHLTTLELNDVITRAGDNKWMLKI